MKTCRFDSCGKQARTQGLCPGHYRQHRLGQELRPLNSWVRKEGTCQGPECDREIDSGGLCGSHKSQRLRGVELFPIGSHKPGPARMYDDVPCAFEGCNKPAYSKNLCNGHVQQLRRGMELRPLGWRAPRELRQCSVEGCTETVEKRGMCGAHYRQVLRTGKTQRRRFTQKTGRYVDPSTGYASIRRPGHPHANQHSGRGLEHRILMSDHLKRPLFPDENVHHVNGFKDDNRLENLELWSTKQPKGQRVIDKLAWA